MSLMLSYLVLGYNSGDMPYFHDFQSPRYLAVFSKELHHMQDYQYSIVVVYIQVFIIAHFVTLAQ